MTDESGYDHELVAWLCEQIAIDQRVVDGSGDLGWLTFREPDESVHHTEAACLAADGVWIVAGGERQGYASAKLVYRESERRADLAAKLRIIDWAVQFMEGDYAPWNETCLQLLALPYAGRPGYQQSWRPTDLSE